MFFPASYILFSHFPPGESKRFSASVHDEQRCYNLIGSSGAGMDKVFKIVLVCIACIGIITAIVYLVKWLF